MQSVVDHGLRGGRFTIEGHGCTEPVRHWPRLSQQSTRTARRGRFALPRSYRQRGGSSLTLRVWTPRMRACLIFAVASAPDFGCSMRRLGRPSNFTYASITSVHRSPRIVHRSTNFGRRSMNFGGRCTKIVRRCTNFGRRCTPFHWPLNEFRWPFHPPRWSLHEIHWPFYEFWWPLNQRWCP